MRLGVNVDHIATLRQARMGVLPDPVTAAVAAENAGADGITVHLREDRRHIQDDDVRRLKSRLKTKLNLEMAATDEMIRLAEQLRPDDVCLVPERREELTTEGGLDVAANPSRIRAAAKRLEKNGIRLNLFVDPEERQIRASRDAGAHGVEIHTGRYCGAANERSHELRAVIEAAALAHRLGLEVHAGHGLDYENIMPIARIPEIVEVNIGHSIVARAVFVGIGEAVREMKDLLNRARHLATTQPL
jgi:pyridoxine 5-phosphate synthase